MQLDARSQPSPWSTILLGESRVVKRNLETFQTNFATMHILYDWIFIPGSIMLPIAVSMDVVQIVATCGDGIGHTNSGRSTT